MKTALVTGASGGLGAAVARELGRRGYRLVLQYRTSRESLDDIARGIETEVVPVGADLATRDGIGEVLKAVHSLGDALHALVNTAGITREALLVRTSETMWDEVFDINLHAPFRLLRALIPVLAAVEGHALFVLSHAGRHGRAGLAAYAASKAALEGLVVAASRELGERGIRVNGVTPGFMLTEMGKGASEEARKRALRENPLSQFADPDDAAKFIADILETRTITGQVLPHEGRVV